MNKNLKRNEEQAKVVTNLFETGTLTSKGQRPSMPMQVGMVLHFIGVEPAEFQGNNYLNFVCTQGTLAAKHLIRTNNGLDEILADCKTDQEAMTELAAALPFSVRINSLTKDYRDNPIFKFNQFQQPAQTVEDVTDATVVE